MGIGAKYGIARSSGRSSELTYFLSIIEPFWTVPDFGASRLKAVTYKGNGRGIAGR
jgi:hypothetical protein